jgi:putative copper export protein
MRCTVHAEKMLYKSQRTREKKERIVVHIREFAPLIIVFVMFLTVVGGLVAHVANDPRYATAAAFQPFGK